MAKIHTPVPALKLNDGNSIPMLGYGVGTAWHKRDGASDDEIDNDLVNALKIALGMGYYHLDASESYGTEKELGKALKESGVAREKLFITTKVNQGMKDIPGALKASLSRLGLDYVDLYLIHKPWIGEDGDKAAAADLQKLWKEMEALRAQGLTKSIGVSNFLPEHLSAIMENAQIAPAANQIEHHAYLQRHELLAFHKKHGIATVAYAPLAPVTRAAPGPIDEYVDALCKKYAVNPSEIMIRWCVDQDAVAITTTSKEQRMSDYLRAMTFKLTPVEIDEMNKLGSQKHWRGFWRAKFSEDDKR